MTEKNVCFSWLASGYDSRNNHLVAAGGLFFPCFQERENKKNPPKTQTRTPNHSPQDSFARRTTSNKHDRNILTPQQKMYINKQKKRKEKKTSKIMIIIILIMGWCSCFFFSRSLRFLGPWFSSPFWMERKKNFLGGDDYTIRAYGVSVFWREDIKSGGRCLNINVCGLFALIQWRGWRAEKNKRMQSRRRRRSWRCWM